MGRGTRLGERPPIQQAIIGGDTWVGLMGEGSNRSTKIIRALGGLFIGGMIIIGANEKVFADNGEIIAINDTPERIVVSDGNTLYKELKLQGYTHDEIVRDLERHGISVEEAQHLNVAPGTEWVVDQSTVNERAQRLGEFDSTILAKGDTVLDVMARNGIPASRVQEILKLNNLTEESARHLPIGFNVVLPSEKAQSVVLTLREKGDNFYKQFVNLGVQEYAVQILADNGLSVDDAKHLKVGTSITVDGKYFSGAVSPVIAVDEKQTPNAESLESKIESVYIIGDSLSVGLDKLGNLNEIAGERGVSVTVDAVERRSLGEALMTVDLHEVVNNDAVIIELGTNAKESDEEFAQDIRGFITSIRFTASSLNLEAPQIFLVTQFESGDHDTVRDETRNQIIIELADELGLEVIDWAKYANDNPEVYEGGDGIHPSNYTAMAELFVDNLTPAEDSTVETVAPPENVTLEDMLVKYREAYQNGQIDIGWLGVFLQNASLQHPELSEQLGITPENVSQIFLLPNPQPGFDYVVNPQTCNAESYVSAPVLAFLIAVQDYARWLTETDPRFTQYQGFEFEIGDLNSGVHKKHYELLAVDLRSRFPGAEAVLLPSGPLFMTGMNGYDYAFTEEVYRFALGLTYGGEPMLEHLITGSEEMERDLTGQNRRGDNVVFASDHPDHTHFQFRDIFAVSGYHSDALPRECEAPETLGHTTAETPLDDQTLETAPVVEMPVVPEVTTPSVPEVSTPVTETTPPKLNEIVNEETLATAWSLSPEEYVRQFNNGEHKEVRLRGYDYSIEVPAEVQKVVDIVFRLEGGYTEQEVQEALTVALAESGLDNTAVNKRGGDSCLFQINKVNRQLVEQLGYDFDTLNQDIEACVRVAFAIFESSIGRQYSEELISQWEEKYGLVLPEDLRVLAVSGHKSDGWYAWLMSSRRTGLL